MKIYLIKSKKDYDYLVKKLDFPACTLKNNFNNVCIIKKEDNITIATLGVVKKLYPNKDILEVEQDES